MLVGAAGTNYFLANIVTIVTCSIVNFVVSDRFVFEGPWNVTRHAEKSVRTACRFAINRGGCGRVRG
jgi:putative flippase GtrA